MIRIPTSKNSPSAVPVTSDSSKEVVLLQQLLPQSNLLPAVSGLSRARILGHGRPPSERLCLSLPISPKRR